MDLKKKKDRKQTNLNRFVIGRSQVTDNNESSDKVSSPNSSLYEESVT